ncbi:MAG: hypothetical protein ACQCN6_01895 [Candidatus Bathyarchaeia archaeon]
MKRRVWQSKTFNSMRKKNAQTWEERGETKPHEINDALPNIPRKDTSQKKIKDYAVGMGHIQVEAV